MTDTEQARWEATKLVLRTLLLQAPTSTLAELVKVVERDDRRGQRSIMESASAHELRARALAEILRD